MLGCEVGMRNEPPAHTEEEGRSTNNTARSRTDLKAVFIGLLLFSRPWRMRPSCNFLRISTSRRAVSSSWVSPVGHHDMCGGECHHLSDARRAGWFREMKGFVMDESLRSSVH